MPRSSRLQGFYQRSLAERLAIVADWAGLTQTEIEALQAGLRVEQADALVENVIATLSLPLGIAVNFLVNGRDYLIPMAIEEPSVVAGCSHAAKLVREGGGFQAEADPPVMIGQIQVFNMPDLDRACGDLRAARDEILALADSLHPSLVARGGGARDIEVRVIADAPAGPMLVVHLLYDVRDAMGANIINTTCEALAPLIESITGGCVVLRILSNLADRRLARARCRVPVELLATGEFDGPAIAGRIAAASALAVCDPHRAATHNKGILNGVDAVAIATGNDWRGIEAGAHAWAARSGKYTALSEWRVSRGIEEGDTGGCVEGRIELPLAVGIVGGTTQAHPTAQVALKILGVTSAPELAGVMAAVGLAQNLGALRALAAEGIQRGHMALHARQIAVAAGATGERVENVAERLVAEGNIRLARAREILTALGKAQ